MSSSLGASECQYDCVASVWSGGDGMLSLLIMFYRTESKDVAQVYVERIRDSYAGAGEYVTVENEFVVADQVWIGNLHDEEFMIILAYDSVFMMVTFFMDSPMTTQDSIDGSVIIVSRYAQLQLDKLIDAGY